MYSIYADGCQAIRVPSKWDMKGCEDGFGPEWRPLNYMVRCPTFIAKCNYAT